MNYLSLEKAYSEIKEAIGNKLEFESFKVVKSVDEHRNFWKPNKVKVLLLAESHVFTRDSEHDSEMKYYGFSELKECPTGYVKLVYCLGYGEGHMVNIPTNRGTPQFWKIFVSCLNQNVNSEGKKILLTETPDFLERIRNKISMLEQLKKKGIWLVDASIVALYNDTRKPDSDMMERIIKISWRNYISKVIQEENPEKIIVIGKGVHRILERELRQTNIPIHVQSQPQGIRTKEGIKEAYEKYHRLCNS